MWLDNAPVGWNHGEEVWRTYYHDTQGYTFRPVEGGVEGLIRRVAPALNGLVLYDQDAKTDQVFLALNLANGNGCLPANRRLYDEQRAAFGDAPVRAAIPRDAFSQREVYEWLIREVLPQTDRRLAFSHRFLPGQLEHGPYQSLDYAFYRRCFIFDLAAGDDITEEGAALMDRLFVGLQRPAYIFGWGDSEFEFCKRLSLRGHTMCCSVAAPNLSFHAAVKPLDAPPFPPDPPPSVERPERKLYVAFVTNEGDTATVLTQMYYRAWSQPGRGKVPITWATNPAYAELFPAAVEYYRRTRTPQDTFAFAPAGPGYWYPQYTPLRYVGAITAKTRRLLKLGFDLREMVIWQGDSTPALETLVAGLPGLRGVTLEHEVRAGMRIAPPDGSRSVPVLGHGGKQQYWITREELVKDSRVDLDAMTAYLEGLYEAGPLPQFLPFYGCVEGIVNDLAELNARLDPARIEIVSLRTLCHLAAQTEPAPDLPTLSPRFRWSGAILRDRTAWDAMNDAKVTVTDEGLRVEIAAERAWGGAAVPALLLPPNARTLRVRVADLKTDRGWVLKCYGDFAHVGWNSTLLPFGMRTKAREAEAALSSQVLGAIDEPMTQLQVALEGQPGDYVVIESIEFLPGDD